MIVHTPWLCRLQRQHALHITGRNDWCVLKSETFVPNQPLIHISVVQCSFHFPSQHHQLTPSGGNNYFTATSVKLETVPQLSTFAMPQPPLTPPDTHFDPQASRVVQAWHTRSGHVLVQPSINGRSLGYMMLDTGIVLRCAEVSCAVTYMLLCTVNLKSPMLCYSWQLELA